MTIPLTLLARSNSTVKDLFIYLYDLAPPEMDVLTVLIKNRKAMTLEELSKKVDKDKSGVFRSLKKLVSSGICSKETRALKQGGYYHLYNSIPVNTFKTETEKRVKELEESIHRLMKKFESDLDSMVVSYYYTQEQ